MTLSKKQQGLRANAIGSSEIGVLAGLSRWSTPAAIWETKVTDYEQDSSLAMDLGVELEEPICRVYAKRKERFLTRVDTVIDPKFPLAVASCDRAVFLNREAWKKDLRAKASLEDLKGAEKILEAKSTSWRMVHEWGEPGTDQVPEYFLAQTTWQMGVTGVHAADIAVLFDSSRFEVYRMTYNGELFAGLYEIASHFWTDFVLTGKMPPADATDRYREVLGRAFPSDNGQLLQATPEQQAVIAEYAILKECERRLKVRTSRAGNIIRAAIGDNAGLMVGTSKVTWKRQRDGTQVDFEAACNEAVALCGLLLQSPTHTAEQHESLVNQLKSIVQRHTSPKPGHRVLRLAPKLTPLPDSPLALQLGPKEAKDEDESEE